MIVRIVANPSRLTGWPLNGNARYSPRKHATDPGLLGLADAVAVGGCPQTAVHPCAKANTAARGNTMTNRCHELTPGTLSGISSVTLTRAPSGA
jgi:hypothetical protein